MLFIFFSFNKAIGISIYPFAVLIYLKSVCVVSKIDSISVIKLLIFSSISPGNFSSTFGINSFLIQFLIILLSKLVTSSKYSMLFSYAKLIRFSFEIPNNGLLSLGVILGIDFKPLTLVPLSRLIKNVSTLSERV